MLSPFVYKSYYLPVQIIRRKGMKNIILKVSKARDSLVISASPRKSMFYIRQFYEMSREWIEKQLDKPKIAPPPQKKSFYPQMTLTLAEKIYFIEHQEARRKRFEQQDDKLVIYGPHEAFQSILMVCLKNHLKQKCQKWSLHFAHQLQVNINQITIKDVKTRWGSCSSRGNLNYNWRLIFAPDPILMYLCAHEVSHLVHMNHSPDFWAVVSGLCPHYKQARQWLKSHGASLYAYG